MKKVTLISTLIALGLSTTACAASWDISAAMGKPMAQTQSLSDMGNDPAYPPQLYFVGVASSPNSQTDADNLAMAQVQKQITVHVRVKQESGMKSMRKNEKEEGRCAPNYMRIGGYRNFYKTDWIVNYGRWI